MRGGCLESLTWEVTAKCSVQGVAKVTKKRFYRMEVENVFG